MNDTYKLTQLMHFFYTKFNYQMLAIRPSQNDEIWLVNPTNKTYQLIRITLKSIENITYEKERIDNTLSFLASRFRMDEFRFLDIHIGHEELDDSEPYATLMIDTNYLSNEYLTVDYPGLDHVVHEVQDPEVENKQLIDEINAIAIASRKQKRRIKTPTLLVTYIVMALCIINFVGMLLLQSNYSMSSSAVFMGADYKMFTLGLKELWRLFTYGFVHANFFHLLFNMYGLFILGSLLERIMGSKRYAIALFLAIIAGGLFNGAMTSNGIVVGLSGGLYGLTAIYIMLAYRNGFINWFMIIQVIVINVVLSLMMQNAYLVHLGGLISGIICSYIFFNDPEHQKFHILFLVIVFAAMAFKYFTNVPIQPIYGGTDAEILNIYKDLGFSSHAFKLQSALYEVYTQQ